ncbi:MAG: ATP-binding protein [Pseudomonadota bacterium]
MNNRYFKYWSITKPVFISNEKKFYSEGPFQSIFDRLKTQLYIGMNFQIIRGPAGTGKSTILREMSRQLPVTEWDILSLGTISSGIAPNSLTSKLLGFLDTTSSQDNTKTILEIVSSLERLSKSRRKILCLLDINSSSEELTKFEGEIARILEAVRHHNLPLYIIAACPSEKMSLSLEKSDWTGEIPKLTEEEATGYLKWCLMEARLEPSLFTSKMISQFYLEAHGSLLKLSQLAESQLIDLSLDRPGGESKSVALQYPDKAIQIQNRSEPTPITHPFSSETSESDPVNADVGTMKTTTLDVSDDQKTIKTVEISSKSIHSASTSYRSLKQMRQKKPYNAPKTSDMVQESSPIEFEDASLENKKKDEKGTKKSSTSLISLVSLTKDI